MSRRRNNKDIFEIDGAVGYCLFIELDSVEHEMKTASGLIIQTESKRGREAQGCESGTVVDIGPLAFSVHGGAETYGIKVGDRVVFSRYEGLYFDPYEDDPEGHAGYRLIEDEWIKGKLKPRKQRGDE